VLLGAPTVEQHTSHKRTAHSTQHTAASYRINYSILELCAYPGPWLPILVGRLIRKAPNPKRASVVTAICQEVTDALMARGTRLSVAVHPLTLSLASLVGDALVGVERAALLSGVRWMAEVVPAHVSTHLHALRAFLPEATPGSSPLILFCFVSSRVSRTDTELRDPLQWWSASWV
jgi:hypothetical protein